MLAKKNLDAAWWGYDKDNPSGRFGTADRQNPRSKARLPFPVRNNPNQPVFPGGKAGDKGHEKEALRQGVRREVEEETGVNLAQYTPLSITDRYFTCYTNENNKNAINGYATKPAQYDFGFVYVELDQPTFKAVVDQVAKNLGENKKGHSFILEWRDHYRAYGHNNWQIQKSCKTIQNSQVR